MQQRGRYSPTGSAYTHTCLLWTVHSETPSLPNMVPLPQKSKQASCSSTGWLKFGMTAPRSLTAVTNKVCNHRIWKELQNREHGGLERSKHRFRHRLLPEYRLEKETLAGTLNRHLLFEWLVSITWRIKFASSRDSPRIQHTYSSCASMYSSCASMYRTSEKMSKLNETMITAN